MPDKNSIVISHAYNLGAQIIEKHFTLDRLKGKKNNDHFHSMDLQDIKKFRSNIDLINKIEGKEKFRKVLKCEKSSRKNARRSLFTYGIINKGEKISYKNIIAKRPGDGISPMLISQIINKKVKRSLKDDHKLKFSDIK